MAEIYDFQAFRDKTCSGREKEQTGVRPVTPARRDQVVISFEAGRAALEHWKAREGVKKYSALPHGMLSFQAANEQRERSPGALESQIIQELAAIQGAEKARQAAPLGQTDSTGQEPGGLARAREEETHRQLLQKAEKNLTAEWRRREALREATVWVYLPELLRYLKLGGREGEKRLSLKPPENESVGFVQVFLELFFGLLGVFADEDEKKSAHADKTATA